jgi:3-phenylpropionate/trans-cinnamate dioxygenase ferredoxin reductase subunit
MRTVVIVGAGLAGARAAETLRAEGFDGRVLLLGEEPVAPYERPALSKAYLAGSRSEEALLLRKPGFWDDRGIELRLGRRVVSIDPLRSLVRTTAGEELDFDDVVVATGARPRRPPFALPEGVHELRTLADARALRAALARGCRLVVVGGGLVGAEVASTALSLGACVTIVETAPAPLARVLGERVGRLLVARWRDHGVDVRLGVGVGGLDTDAAGRVTSVRLTDGTDIPADAVLVGIGVVPARELLPDGPVPGVLAAGDVVGPGHWTAAAHDGAAAARRILGLRVPPPQPPYVWSDQFGQRLQLVGSPPPGGGIELEGADDSYVVRFVDPQGAVAAALFADRPLEAADLRRRLAEGALACAA